MLHKKTAGIFLSIVISGLAGYLVGYTMGNNSKTMTSDTDILRKGTNDDVQLVASNHNIDACQAGIEAKNNPALSDAFLATVYRAVSEILQKQLHQEMKLAIDVIRSEQPNSVPQAKTLPPEKTRQLVEKANGLIEEAISRGRWGRDEASQFSQAVQSLPHEEMMDAQNKLTKAINEGKLQVDIEALLQLQ